LTSSIYTNVHTSKENNTKNVRLERRLSCTLCVRRRGVEDYNKKRIGLESGQVDLLLGVVAVGLRID